jgi:hypothetical protein
MKRYALLVAFLSTACVSQTPTGAKVRITSNLETVKGCAFLANVTATSSFGGAGGTAIGTSNTEKTLQNKTAQLGGNVLFVVSSGVHAAGEAFYCDFSGAAHVVPGLEPGTKLYGGDGSTLGVIRAVLADDVLVELTNGQTMRVKHQQALAMLKKPAPQ